MQGEDRSKEKRGEEVEEEGREDILIILPMEAAGEEEEAGR